jgi:thiol-disulfide isomerase/thioredoxin
MKVRKNVLGSVIFLLTGLLVINNAIAQTQEGYTLNGEISGLVNPTKLYLCIFPGKDTVAQTISNDSKFTFKGIVNNRANIYFIKMDTLVSKKPSKAIWLMNKPIKLKSNLTSWPLVKVEGSEAQNDYDSLMRSWEAVKDKGHDTIVSVYRNFIKHHPNSLYVANLISICRRIFGTEWAKTAYDNLSQRAKSSHFGLILKKENQVQPGTVLPDFKISTPDGKFISVLQCAKKGKVTLIDFWASWCGPCRRATPNLKKVYDAFHNKGFNIIGISTDKIENQWRAALAEDDSPWIHGRDNLDNASKGIFSISAIPAFALLDGEGKLIAFHCAMSNIESFGPEIHGEGLYKTIENLLLKNEK